MPSVTLRAVGRHFAGLKAVDDIDLSIEDGDHNLTTFAYDQVGEKTSLTFSSASYW